MKESINSSQICLLKASDDLVMLCHVHGLDCIFKTRTGLDSKICKTKFYRFTDLQSVFYKYSPVRVLQHASDVDNTRLSCN
jgi:hypothetical protein